MLERLPPEDLPLRPRLEAALAAARADSGLLSRPAAESWAPLLVGPLERPAFAPGTRLGAWEIEGELGRGGMGTVYAVRRADGAYEQHAALKLLAASADEPAARARFLQERQILARLEHPAIARLLDGGVAPDGRPWLALERVDGLPITAFADARRPRDRGAPAPLPRRCSARSTSRTATWSSIATSSPRTSWSPRAGEVKLLDFGIAKLLDRDGRRRAHALRRAAHAAVRRARAGRRAARSPPRPTSTPSGWCSTSCSPGRAPTGWRATRRSSSSGRFSRPIPEAAVGRGARRERGRRGARQRRPSGWRAGWRAISTRSSARRSPRRPRERYPSADGAGSRSRAATCAGRPIAARARDARRAGAQVRAPAPGRRRRHGGARRGARRRPRRPRLRSPPVARAPRRGAARRGHPDASCSSSSPRSTPSARSGARCRCARSSIAAPRVSRPSCATSRARAPSCCSPSGRSIAASRTTRPAEALLDRGARAGAAASSASASPEAARAARRAGRSRTTGATTTKRALALQREALAIFAAGGRGARAPRRPRRASTSARRCASSAASRRRSPRSAQALALERELHGEASLEYAEVAAGLALTLHDLIARRGGDPARRGEALRRAAGCCCRAIIRGSPTRSRRSASPDGGGRDRRRRGRARREPGDPPPRLRRASTRRSSRGSTAWRARSRQAARFDEALAVREEAMPLARRILAPESDSLAVQANNFATLNFRLRRFEAAAAGFARGGGDLAADGGREEHAGRHGAQQPRLRSARARPARGGEARARRGARDPPRARSARRAPKWRRRCASWGSRSSPSAIAPARAPTSTGRSSSRAGSTPSAIRASPRRSPRAPGSRPARGAPPTRGATSRRRSRSATSRLGADNPLTAALRDELARLPPG